MRTFGRKASDKFKTSIVYFKLSPQQIDKFFVREIRFGFKIEHLVGIRNVVEVSHPDVVGIRIA